MQEVMDRGYGGFASPPAATGQSAKVLLSLRRLLEFGTSLVLPAWVRGSAELGRTSYRPLLAWRSRYLAKYRKPRRPRTARNLLARSIVLRRRATSRLVSRKRGEV